MEFNIFKTKEMQNNFIDQNWNKKFCVFNNAVNNIYALDNELIHDLLQDEDIESRLITNKKNKTLSYGPFNNKEILATLKSDYTFIIHNLTTLFEELYPLENIVSFLNNYEFDDVICTYSNKDMGLGAHFDPYNVFIVQASGQRKWLIDEDPKFVWKDDEEIKILKEFNPTHEVILNPGDMIYIPPHCAHHGISLSDSLSYSIGFKALEMHKLLKDYFIQNIEELDQFKISKTSGLEENHFPKDLINNFKEFISENLLDDKKIEKFLIKEITKPKEEISGYEEFDLTTTYNKNPYLKWCIHKKEDKKVIISINSKTYTLSEKEFQYLEKYLTISHFDNFNFKASEEIQSWDFLKEIVSDGNFIEK